MQRQSSNFTRFVAAILMTTTLAGCTTFGPVSAREYLPIQHPSNIWITKSDNSVVKMQAPKLLGDTLVGYVNGEFQEMRLSQTKQIQAKRPAPGRTAIAAGAVIVGVAAGAALVIGSGGNACLKWDGGTGTWIPCVDQTVH